MGERLRRLWITGLAGIEACMARILTGCGAATRQPAASCGHRPATRGAGFNAGEGFGQQCRCCPGRHLEGRGDRQSDGRRRTAAAAGPRISASLGKAFRRCRAASRRRRQATPNGWRCDLAAGGFDLVIAAGGDGTASEAADGLLQAFRRAAGSPSSACCLAGPAPISPAGSACWRCRGDD